jgi:hypothetical protein
MVVLMLVVLQCGSNSFAGTSANGSVITNAHGDSDRPSSALLECLQVWLLDVQKSELSRAGRYSL